GGPVRAQPPPAGRRTPAVRRGGGEGRATRPLHVERRPGRAGSDRPLPVRRGAGRGVASRARPLCWRAAHRGRGTGVVAPSPGPDRRRTSVPPDGAGGPGGAGRRPRDVVVPTRLDRHGPSIARSHPDQLFATRPAGELRIAVR